MNANEEFHRLIKKLDLSGYVLAAMIRHHPEPYKDAKRRLILYPDHTADEYHEFLRNLNFDYDAGFPPATTGVFGSQELFGTIWFSNDTWAVRAEYDGEEWWVPRSLPVMPQRPPSFGYYKNKP